MRESPESIHARKAALIAAIAAGKTVIEAAAESGIGWRRAYVWRAEDRAFRAAWDQARAQIKARVPAELVVPSSSDPAAPLPAFHVPPSPPLPPPRWRGRPPQPPVTVIIEPFKPFEDVEAVTKKVPAKPSPPQTDDDGVY